MVFATERIARTNIFEAYSCTYIARTDVIHGVLFVGVHLEYSRYSLFFARTHIVYIRACLQFTRIYAEETETSYVWVCSYFERQSTQRFAFVGSAL